MGFWRSAVDWFTVRDAMPPPGSASFSDPSPRPIDQVIAEMANYAGRVSRSQAISVPAVLRGRNLICGELAGLPLVQYGPNRETVRLALLDQIDPEVANVVTIAQTAEDLLFEGVSWWQITARDATGYPTSATHLDYSSVSVNPPSGRLVAPLPAGEDPRRAVLYVGGETVPARDLIRFDSPNPGLLKAAGRPIRHALLLDKTAETYAGNPRPLDFFTPAEGADPADDGAIADLLAAWRESRKASSTAYVPAAVKYNAVDVMSPSDLQLVAMQTRASLDIANALGIDPEDLGISTTSRTYQNAIDRRRDRINGTLQPYMRAITDRLSMPDVTKRGYVVRFDLDDYLRADPVSRTTYYQAMKGMGALTADEIRAEEGLPELTPAQRLELAPPAPAEPPQPALRARAELGPVQFDADLSTSFIADLPTEQFAVNTESRTITGLVVPYGPIGVKNGQRFQFAPGSLRWTELKRVKLLRDHDFSQAVGVAVEFTDTPQGLRFKFSVARGMEGDRVLALAEDGVLDGLSVGVDFIDVDRSHGVFVVKAAHLKEVSLTAVPAFDDARVSSLAASADPVGDIVPDIDTPTTPAAVPVDFNAAFAQFMATYRPPAPAAPVQPETPAFVNPVPREQRAEVKEGPLYRFDGKPGQRCFTADIATGAFRDDALRERAEQFIADQMEGAFANISTTNVAGLNPTIQRPDLYVPSLHFARPIGSMVTGGVVSELTTQRLPKFSSSSGLAATHAQGVEPTDGAFAATTQDVTPVAISGRVTVNREVIDQGGTPQTDQLIWNEMTKFYAETLEKRIVDALQALSLSDTPIVGTDADLQDALLSYFATLQFIAGGDRYRALALHQDLYTAVMTAVDEDGRALFPMLNPTNAQGTTASDFSAVRVGSKVGVPAWALASGNNGPDKSFLFVPESVYQWFSPPRRIDLDRIAVATVGIGIWGYSAEFVSRNADVVQLAYTVS